LSDGTAKAKPESLLKPYEICDNDIIMLCTDGLSGMIRDSEIESVMRHNECNMDALVDELIKAACEAEGSDNITICLCQILQGGSSCNPAIFIDYDKRLNGNGNGNKNQTSTTIVNSSKEDTSKSKLIWLIGITCVIIAILSVAIWWFTYRKSQSVNGVNDNQTGQVHTEEPTYDDAKANNAIKTEPDVNTTDVSVREDKAKTTNNATGTIFQKTASTKTAEKTDAEEDDTDLTPIPNSDEQETPTAEVPQTETHKYKVLKGDSYYSIAKKFNIDVDVLKRLNNNIDLKAGATIKLPK
jgi:LysM repeat protein